MARTWSESALTLYGLRLLGAERAIDVWLKEGFTHFGFGVRGEHDSQPILTTDPDEAHAAFDLNDEQDRLYAAELVMALALIGYDIDDYEAGLLELVNESLAGEVRSAMLGAMGYDVTSQPDHA